jgi:guanylate kinase
VPDPDAPTDLILVIEVQGAEQILNTVPDAVMILLVPPSRAVQAERLRARGDTEDRITKRLQAADAEVEVGRRLAHHVVVNDQVERAVGEVAGILASYRKTP